MDLPYKFIIGALVESPYVLTSTFVAVKLGTHESIPSDHRAISTVTGIIAGTASIGAAFGPILALHLVMANKSTIAMYGMALAQFASASCLVRLVSEDLKKPSSTATWSRITQRMKNSSS